MRFFNIISDKKNLNFFPTKSELPLSNFLYIVHLYITSPQQFSLHSIIPKKLVS